MTPMLQRFCDELAIGGVDCGALWRERAYGTVPVVWASSEPRTLVDPTFANRPNRIGVRAETIDDFAQASGVSRVEAW